MVRTGLAEKLGNHSIFSPMPLSLEMADRISNAVVAACKRHNFAPITVVVTDANALPLVTKRMDGCAAVGIPQFALAKATTCAAMKMSSRSFRDRYTSSNDPQRLFQMAAMVSIAQSVGSLAPFPGGVLLRDDTGVLGAIGVSGAAGDEDELCALEGAREGRTLMPALQTDPRLE